MKNLFFLFALLSTFIIKAQSDTIFLKDSQKIPAKVFEVLEFEVKYKRADLTEGPMFSKNIEDIRKIKFSNGFEQSFAHDELAVQQDRNEILAQKNAIKFHIFDLSSGKISFGYEHVIKTGISTDIKFGFFSSQLFSSFRNAPFEYSGSMNPYGATSASGTFIKGGSKFLVGEDFTVKGMRYAHPLKGRYIRIDLYLSYINYNNIKYQISVPSGTAQGSPYPNPYPTIEKSTNAKNYNYGFLINYGRQFVLGNILTLEYYVGIGFGGSSYNFSQPDFGVNGPIDPNALYSYSYYNTNSFANVLCGQRLGKVFTGTAGFSLGYIYKSKTPVKRTSTAN